MINLLTKHIAHQVRTLFNVTDVYVAFFDAEEFVAIGRRVLETTDLPVERKLVSVFSKPMIFLKVVGIGYDMHRSGYRQWDVLGRTWLESSKKYIMPKLLTTEVDYEVRVYTLTAAQGLDLYPLMLMLDRSSKIVGRFRNFEIDIPVTSLVTEVSEEAVEFTMQDLGLKVYRLVGRIQVFSYLFPVDVIGSRGEEKFIEWWTDGRVDEIVVEPLKEVKLKYVVGGKIVDEDEIRANQ